MAMVIIIFSKLEKYVRTIQRAHGQLDLSKCDCKAMLYQLIPIFDNRRRFVVEVYLLGRFWLKTKRPS